ncbi:phage tail tape measure protein, partial [Escherichia coli]|nr:phage tail tape measure protein [Escherichia coli]
MKTSTIPTLLGPDGMTSLREYAGYHGGGSGFGGQLRAWNPPSESVDAALLPNFKDQLRGSWMAGLKSGWSEWEESATDSMSQVKSAATQTFDGIAQNMAAMLTGSEQNWRSFTRSVLSMMTEILLKQAMVGIVGSIGSAIGGAVGGGASASGGTAIQA